ncbi:MAG: aldehyde dehydrogenase family protein [Desulfobacterales bacterium]|uniref:Aldehyde dehydrogenase family protein n=1 Tax=Candidatus Desulfatibia vada TaxID=2841696 RepID=A0A8J6NYZ9_9BACT|nr:aldehyde dehydrogenase family protein [Candidatus Desulfatibia vada]
MDTFESRFEKVHALIAAIRANRHELVDVAVQDTGFTFRECNMEVDGILSDLHDFETMAPEFALRRPICESGQAVALVLPYNGSAWLNNAIISIYMVGNPVRVKFASRDSDIARYTESLYRPIFGDTIRFDYSDGRTFLQKAVADRATPAICLFGADDYAGQYREDIKALGKKFVFEGPGNDPFIVLPDADLETAARELAFSKYIYAGQTCTAPERVYVHRSIHDDFLALFLDLSRAVKIGDPSDPSTEMGSVASAKAVAAIKAQLKDAVHRGAHIALGGQIEGNLVYPTVVINARSDMLGMQEESFGPVTFISTFDEPEEALKLARDNRYGLRASIFGNKTAASFAEQLVGEPYCHPVPETTYGRFGTVGVNQPRSETWISAFVSKPVGGYGLSGWIWETVADEFIIKQGPKLLSLETSCPKD